MTSPTDGVTSNSLRSGWLAAAWLYWQTRFRAHCGVRCSRRMRAYVRRIAWEVIRQSGLTAAKLAELSEGRGPQEMTDDESVVFAFSNELARSGRVGTSFRNGCRESLRASMRVGPPYCMSGSPTLRCRCPNA